MIPDESELLAIVNALDDVLLAYSHVENQNLAGVLLSRVVLLMSQEPTVGKELVRYVWERLDDIESNNPKDLL